MLADKGRKEGSGYIAFRSSKNKTPTETKRPSLNYFMTANKTTDDIVHYNMNETTKWDQIPFSHGNKNLFRKIRDRKPRTKRFINYFLKIWKNRFIFFMYEWTLPYICIFLKSFTNFIEQDITALIFCVALSEYNLKMAEDTRTNRMYESLGLFQTISNNRYFEVIKNGDNTMYGYMKVFFFCNIKGYVNIGQLSKNRNRSSIKHPSFTFLTLYSWVFQV